MLFRTARCLFLLQCTDVEDAELSDSFSAAKETAASSKLSVRVEPLSLESSAQKSQRRSDLHAASKIRGDDESQNTKANNSNAKNKKNKIKLPSADKLSPKSERMLKKKLREKMRLKQSKDELLDDASLCGFHKTAYRRSARTGAQYCTQCKDTEKWETGDYQNLLNGPLAFQPIQYCKIHEFSVLRMSSSNRNFSYCTSCAETHDSLFTYSRTACSKHGPHKEKECPKCSRAGFGDPSKTRKVLPVHEFMPLRTQNKCNIHKEGYIYKCYMRTNKEPVLVCRSCRKVKNMSLENHGYNHNKHCQMHPEADVHSTETGSSYCSRCASVEVLCDVVCRLHPTKSIRISEFGNSRKRYVLGCMQCRYLSAIVNELQLTTHTKKSEPIHCLIHPHAEMIMIGDGQDGFCSECAADYYLISKSTAAEKSSGAAELGNAINDPSDQQNSSIPLSVTQINMQPTRRRACVEGHTLVRYVADQSSVMVDVSAGLTPASQSCTGPAVSQATQEFGERDGKNVYDSDDMSGEETSSVRSATSIPTNKSSSKSTFLKHCFVFFDGRTS